MSNHLKCISCGLEDDLVEAGGIWYCPNPFCTASGASNWKITNLKCSETEILDMDEYKEKGIKHIFTYPEELKNKIIALPMFRKITNYTGYDE